MILFGIVLVTGWRSYELVTKSYKTRSELRYNSSKQFFLWCWDIPTSFCFLIVTITVYRAIDMYSQLKFYVITKIYKPKKKKNSSISLLQKPKKKKRHWRNMRKEFMLQIIQIQQLQILIPTTTTMSVLLLLPTNMRMKMKKIRKRSNK